MTSAPRKPIFKVKMVGSDFTDTNEFYVPFVVECLTLFAQQVSILVLTVGMGQTWLYSANRGTEETA